MRIVLEFPGFLQITGVDSGGTSEVAEGKTVSQLLDDFGIAYDHQRYIIPIVNREEKRLDYVLQDGDHLFLYVPVGGG
ncbi:MAG: MoaD/ThiS family protein [Acidobacteria bacterium]|nr:MoaD/ThiS family protein [Acidobacteriota bacterium]